MTPSGAAYIGVWTNWSEGRIAGATITLSTRDGAYLVAFLALFIKLVGRSTWQLMSYFVFRTKASTQVVDRSTRQQLLVLRNISSDYSALLELVKIPVGGERRRRPIALLLTAALHAAALAAAGIFASRITTTKSEVLLRPMQCGSFFLHDSDVVDEDYATAQFATYLIEDLTRSARIASQCYNSSDPLAANCNAYGRRMLAPTVTTSKKCPFAPSICIGDTSVRIDSGFISSLHDLGINSRPSDSVSFRKIVECAPIMTEGFSATYNASNLPNEVSAFFYNMGQSIKGDEFTAFFYGPSVAYGTDATFVFDNGTFDTSLESRLVPYRTSSEFASPRSDLRGSTFEPIRPLNRTDAEVILLFLANAALYLEPVFDPWFNAQTPVIDPGKIGNYTLYAAEKPVAVLACTDQTEICNAAIEVNQSCMTLPAPYVLSPDVLGTVTTQLQLTPRQLMVLGRFYEPLHDSLNTMATIGADGGLLASTMTNLWLSTPLPDNQWILELQHWFAVFLVSVQLRVVEYTIWLHGPAYDHRLTPPTSDEEWMCTNQVVQRDDYASFSFLGLCVILCSGMLVFLVNLVLRNVRPRLWHMSTASQHCDERWKSYELMELQLPESSTGNVGVVTEIARSGIVKDNILKCPKAARQLSCRCAQEDSVAAPSRTQARDTT